MTIKTIINAVCDTLSLDRFPVVYGNNDPNAQTMMQLAKQGGDEIARRVDWRSMLKQASIASAPLPLPSDFHRVIPGGGVFTADGAPVRPSTNGAEWMIIKTVASSQPYFFLDPMMINISPAAAGIGATILYVSKNWISSGSSEQSDFSSDDDVCLFPERLLEKDIVWRWRRQNGLVYDDQLSEFEADITQEIKANRGLA